MVVLPRLRGVVLQVGKIDDHAVFGLAFDSDLDFIGMAVQRTALRVAGQKMGAVHVLGHA